MTAFKAAVALLQIARQIISYLERQKAIDEGRRQIITQELGAVAAAAQITLETEASVKDMTDDEVDAALRGDYRPGGV